MARRWATWPLAVAWLLHALAAASDCFVGDADYKAPEQRTNLTVHGVSMPLGLVPCNWDSAFLFNSVAKILIQEKLGVHTNVTFTSSSSWSAFYAIGRCSRWTNGSDPGCGPPQDFALRHHVLLETWAANLVQDRDWFGVNHPQDQPVYCGEFSFTGYEGHFLRSSTNQRAVFTQGSHMDNYAFYNGSWYDPAQFFGTRIEDIPTDKLEPCAGENRLHNPSLMQPMKQLFDGLTLDPSGKAVCDPSGYWWLAPACSHNASKCVPWITGGDGWQVSMTMQRALAHSMPIAVAVAANWGSYLNITLTYDVTFYSWEPSLHFINAGPREVTFPLHSAEEWAVGDKRSMMKKIVLKNYVGKPIPQAAPAVHYLITSLDFPLSQVMAALKEVGEGVSYDQAACNWLNRTNIWKPWVQAMKCPSGEGMIDKSGTHKPGWKFVMNESQGEGCGQCEPGRYSAHYSQPAECVADEPCFESRVCRECPAGTAQVRFNQIECDVCLPGTYQNMTKQLHCLDCAVGSYSNSSGSHLCTHCGEGRESRENLATMKRVVVDGEERWAFRDGASDGASCGCTIGAWENGGVCVRCTEEMDCPGMGDLFIKPRYYAPAGRPGFVFRCHGNSQRCPGGLPGTCAAGRIPTSVACSLCEPMLKPGVGGECASCVESDYAPSILLVLGLLVGMIAFYRVVDVSRPAATSSAVLMFAMAGSLLVTMLQQLSVFGSINLQWRPPFSDVLAFLSLFAFDLEYLSLDCIGAVDPLAKYLMRVFVVIMFVLVMLLIHIVAVLVLYKGAFKQRVSSLVGSIGLVFSALFLSIVSSMTAPFMCLPHPNGLRTVRDYPDVICYETLFGRHTSMVLMAGVATLMPLGFLAGVAWVVWRLPERLAAGDTEFFNTFRFLLFRFRPGCYWHVIVFLIRNMLMAIIPAIGMQMAQILMLQCIILPYLAVTIRMMPLSLWVANIMDIMATMMLCMLLIIFALFVNDTDVDPEATALLCVALITVGFVGLIGALFYAVFLRFLRRGKPFAYFICHHKLGAGNFARLLKVCFQQTKQVTKKVFVDSDDLRDLSCLFDFVRSDTETLVVLCTKEIFMRPWCVGEVCTAKLAQTRVVKVEFPGFEWPDASFIEQYETNVPDVSSLTAFGMNVGMVQDTLRWFETQASVAFPPEVTNDHLKKLISVLLKVSLLKPGFRENVERSTSSMARVVSQVPSKSANSGGGKNVILADVLVSEAAATALVLHKLLLPVMDDPPVVLWSIEELSQRAKQICLICTNDAFRSPLVIATLALVAQRNLAVLPLVSEASFRFPTKDMLSNIAASSEAASALSGTDMSGEMFARVVARVFKEIAIEVNPQDAEEILNMRCQAVHMRLKSGALKRMDLDMSLEADEASDFRDKEEELLAQYVSALC